MHHTFLSRLGIFFRIHLIGIICALMAGAVIVMPQVWFIVHSGSAYQGIQIYGADAETNYLSRIQEASETGFTGNPYTFEEKGTLPSSYNTYVEYALALPTILFHIPVATTNLWYKFLLPAIAFFLAYLLGYRVTGRRSASLFAASLGILGLQLFSISDIRYFLGFPPSGYEGFTNFANYGRPVNPEASGIVFFVYLHLLWSFWNQKTVWTILSMRRKFLLILALAAVYGASFYVYFYTWTFFTVLNGLFIFACLIEHRFRDAVHYLFITALGLLAAIPYFLNLIAFTAHPYYHDISKTFGFIFTHAPRVSLGGIVTIALFALVCIWQFRRGSWHITHERNTQIFLGVLLLATVIVINQQVITGHLLQEGHYHWYFNTPIFALALAWVISKIAPYTHVRHFLPIISGLVAVAAFTTTIQIQIASYKANESVALSDQAYAPLFTWLNENAAPESVLLADHRISEWTPVYTHLNVYWSDYNFTYLTPRFRVMHALFMYLKLFDIPPEAMPEAAYHPPTDKAEAAFAHKETAILVGNHREYLYGFYPDGMSDFYTLFYTGDFARRLKDYRIDYIAIDTRFDSTWISKIPKSATKVFSEGPIELYRL